MATPKKREPAVIVPCSIRNPDPDHPGLAEVFGDAALRGAWLAVKVIAWQARAQDKGGRIVLSAGDRAWIGGCTKPARTARERSRMVRASDALVRELCTKMSWDVHEHDPFWTVQVGEVHGSCTARDEKLNEIAETTARNSPTCAPSEVRSQKSEERSQKREPKSAASASSSGDRAVSRTASLLPESSAQEPPLERLCRFEELAPEIAEDRPSGRRLEEILGEDWRLLNALKPEDGSDREKELWLADQVNQLRCEEENGKRRLALAVRYYRAYLRRGPTSPNKQRRQFELSMVRERARRRNLDAGRPAEDKPTYSAEEQAAAFAAVFPNGVERIGAKVAR